MYNVYDVVWGVQITEELEKAFNEYYENSPNKDDDDFPASLASEDGGWFTDEYSGDATHSVGYLGKSVYGFDLKGCAEEMKHEMDTFKDFDEVRAMVDKLPECLRKVVGDPMWIFVISTS